MNNRTRVLVKDRSTELFPFLYDTQYTLPAQKESWVVYVSTFPPRACGIATFTEDLTNAFDRLYNPREESKVIAMNSGERTGFSYRKKVIAEIEQDTPADYISAARLVNNSPDIKIVNIQHEYGIYGGNYGVYIIDFMKEVKKPIVLTMHSVLPNPNEELCEVTKRLCAEADRICVMTELSKKFLAQYYSVAEDKVAVVPHGIHALAYSDGMEAKKAVGFEGRKVVSTFGLLHPGKGMDYAIDALPKLVEKHPDLLYAVIGATHPSIYKKEGDAYRNSLVAKVNELGLSKNVVFVNKYLELKELLTYIQATDIYLAVPLDPNQAVSGTLSYALGTGRPVIATKFGQALEDVTPDVGRLVDFRNSGQITDALEAMLANEQLLKKMGEAAYFKTRKMEWRNVVTSYMKQYISLVPELAKREKNLPKIKLRHLIKMTDEFGMFQFARHTTPDPEWGYTVDDNARALIAMVRYYEQFGGTIALDHARVYLNFIEYVAQPDKRWFRNYVSYDKTYHTERNSTEDLNDANSRTLHALAVTAASEKLSFDIRHKAAKLFSEHVDPKRNVVALRTIAHYIKAFDAWLSVEKNLEMEAVMKKYADRLVEAYDAQTSPNWNWFEEEMTYSNGVLPEALFIAHKRFGDSRYLEVATTSLDFLVSYSFQGDVCVPIGQNGWFKKGGVKQIYDQQPEEVAALVLALKKGWEVTKNTEYKKRMRDAFNWYIGNNLLGQVIYDQESGGCYDGMGEFAVNINQGAESSVVYFLARLAVD